MSFNIHVYFRPNDHLILVLDEALGGLEICLNHLLDERIEINLAFPSEKALCLGGVSQQQPLRIYQYNGAPFLGDNALDLSGTEVTWVNLDHSLSGPNIDTLLLDTGTLPAIERRHRHQYSRPKKGQYGAPTGSGPQEHRRPFRQTRGQGAFRQLQGRSLREPSVEASSTSPRCNRELFEESERQSLTYYD